MTYGLHLREQVVAFVRRGGSKSEAAKRFGVRRITIYNWLKAKNLEPKKHGHRRRKLDWTALQKDLEEHPEKLLRERAATFGVNINAIWYAARKLKNGKKTFPFRQS